MVRERGLGAGKCSSVDEVGELKKGGEGNWGTEAETSSHSRWEWTPCFVCCSRFWRFSEPLENCRVGSLP